MHVERRGTGKKLLLVHGLGGHWQSWSTIMLPLADGREVIAVDLPGHGEAHAEADSGTFAGLARALEDFLVAEDLVGVDMIGSSLGGRLVLEMARRGRAGAVVALDPGGFWRGWERTYLRATLLASAHLLRSLRPALPALSRNAISRTLLLAQLSARPWALDGDAVRAELKSYASTPTFDALVHDLASGPAQRGPAAPGTGRVAIGWGRRDRLCLPVQAERARSVFPSARLHWFAGCGHFPMWDSPDETLQLIHETID